MAVRSGLLISAKAETGGDAAAARGAPATIWLGKAAGVSFPTERDGVEATAGTEAAASFDVVEATTPAIGTALSARIVSAGDGRPAVTNVLAVVVAGAIAGLRLADIGAGTASA